MSNLTLIFGLLLSVGMYRLDHFPSNNSSDQSIKKREFDLGHGVKISMIWVVPGTFQMGSPEDELERIPEREKQHEVTITKGFWLAETEFTQVQWEKIMKSNPSQKKGANLPVESVS